MEIPLDFIAELTLRAMSDDYENFDRITQDVDGWAAEGGVISNQKMVLNAVKMLIGRGYAQGYIFSASPSGKAEEAAFSESRLDELWFYVTPAGKELARLLSSRWKNC
jgi:hypothetical protein